MLINRYDQPAQAEFINTYVPIPFDEMMKIGQLKQQMVEENDKVSDQLLSSLNSIKVAPADEQAYISKANKIKGEINDIINNSAPGSYEGKRRLMNLRNNLSTDSELRSMIQNYDVYTDAVKQHQEAEQKGVISANRQDISDTIANLSSGGKGTMGRIKETGGSGVYNRGSWMANVNVNEAMEARVNDVAESSVQQAGIVARDGNKYILEQKTAGKTLNALGAPLGIKFGVNEKGEQVIDLENSNIDIFLSTPEGKQLQNIARENVRKGLAEDAGRETQRLYYSHALAAINERVSTKSEVNLAADPFDQARYKKELEDKEIPWSTPQAIATSASKLTNSTKTEEAKIVIGQQIAKTEEDFAQFKELYGVRESVKTAADGSTYKTYIDKNGVDISESYATKEAEIQTLKNQRQSIDDMVERVKGEIGIPKTWKPDKDVQQAAERKRRNAENEFLYELNSRGHGEITEGQRKLAREQGETAYEAYIQKNDPTWSKLNSALKKNAEKSSAIVTVTKFGSKEMNEQALAEFPLLMENEVQMMGDRRSLSVEEKEKLGIMSGKKQASDPTKVVFGGSMFDPETQKMKFVYQTYDEKGKLSDPFMVNAPEGAVNSLIKSGATSYAKVIIHQQLTQLETNPDKVTEINLGDDSTSASVRMTQPSGEHLKPKWLLKVNIQKPDGTVGQVEKIFDDRTGVIDYYEAYVRTAAQKK